MVKIVSHTERTKVLYTYIQEKNKTWLANVAHKNGTSASAYIDGLIDRERNASTKRATTRSIKKTGTKK